MAVGDDGRYLRNAKGVASPFDGAATPLSQTMSPMDRDQCAATANGYTLLMMVEKVWMLGYFTK